MNYYFFCLIKKFGNIVLWNSYLCGQIVFDIKIILVLFYKPAD